MRGWRQATTNEGGARSPHSKRLHPARINLIFRDQIISLDWANRRQ